MIERLPRWLDVIASSFEQVPQHGCWQPAADVYQTSAGWIVKVDLAGVRPDDLTLFVSGTRLTISGTRRDRMIEEGASHYRMEISYSRFERMIEFPRDVETARIETEMHEGMLFVRIHQETKPS